MTKKRITVKDIANRAGVSRGTVDRVLHSRGQVASEVADKVKKAVKDLGYRPNLLARSLAKQNVYRIATILPKIKNRGYWSMTQSGIDSSMEEISDFGITLDAFEFDANDVQSYIYATEQVLNDRPDGILIAPEFYSQSRSFFESARRLNIPVLCINTQTTEYPNLGFIGPDAFQCGMMAGKLFQMTIPDLSRLMVLNIGASSIDQKHLLHKEQGMRYHFDQSTFSIEIDEADINNYKDQGAFREVMRKKMIDFAPQGIFVTNSRIHHLVPILKDLLINDIALIGFDLIPSNLGLLKKGDINFLIHQNPKMQGAMGIRTMFQYLMNREIPAPIQNVPLDIVMKENCDFYLS